MKLSISKDMWSPAWPEYWYQKFGIEIEIDAIKMLIQNQENSWKKINQKFDEKFNALEDEYHGSYSRDYEIEERTIDELMKQQRYSSCLLIYSFFESKLKALCNLIEENNDFEKKISKYRGSYISKYWQYLIKVFEIEKDKIEPFYDLIIKQKPLRSVRNIIAHQDGYLNMKRENKTQKEQKKEEELKRKIEAVDGLIIEKYGNRYQLKIAEVGFLIDILDKMSKFYEVLLLAIDTRYKEKKPANELKLTFQNQ